MCPSARAALLRWLHNHFNASAPHLASSSSASSPPLVSAIISSIHVTSPLIPLHDPHICSRSLAAAAACSPPHPHALKFAAACADDVACARMQQQAQAAQKSFNLPVCCIAMAGGGIEGSSSAAFTRLQCPTLTFCRPLSATSPTAQGKL